MSVQWSSIMNDSNGAVTSAGLKLAWRKRAPMLSPYQKAAFDMLYFENQRELMCTEGIMPISATLMVNARPSRQFGDPQQEDGAT